MNALHRLFLRLTLLTLLLWGMGAAAAHGHVPHNDAHNMPCDICLIMKSGGEQNAAIALPVAEFSLFMSRPAPMTYVSFHSKSIAITPVRGPPKRGPPAIF